MLKKICLFLLKKIWLHGYNSLCGNAIMFHTLIVYLNVNKATEDQKKKYILICFISLQIDSCQFTPKMLFCIIYCCVMVFKL